MGCKAIFLFGGLLAVALAQAVSPAESAAAASALLTIADGEVTLLRGRARFAAAEGQRLEPMDILHTGSTTRVARLEFDDGSVLDLGPATQVLINPGGTAWPKDRTATAYVAQGWAKLRTPAGAAARRQIGLASATLDLATPGGGVVLARIGRQGNFAFVESGRAQLVEHLAQREPRIFELGEGHAYSRADAADVGSAALRPSLVQLRETPRALADTLPLRADQWARNAAPDLAEPQALLVGEVERWLDMEPALSSALRTRFFGPTRIARPAGSRNTAGASARISKPGRVAVLTPKRLAPATAIEHHALAQSLDGEPSSALAISTDEPAADLPAATMLPARPAAVFGARPRLSGASTESTTASRVTARAGHP
jgi:hypothetical protein